MTTKNCFTKLYQRQKDTIFPYREPQKLEIGGGKPYYLLE